MTDLHLFNGEKGGVGKSFVCRTMIAYHLHNDIDFAAFDVDRSNADVLRIYGKKANCKAAILSEADKYDDAANIVFNTALDGQRVLVNLPAQSMPSLKQWIELNELFEVAKEGDVRFVNWFVSDCGLDSLKLFSEQLDLWGEDMLHVFVANYGMTERWDRLKQDKALMNRMKDGGVKLLKFPKFIGRADRDLIDELSLTFDEAKAHDDLGAIGRQHVKSFLRKAFAEFDRVGVLTDGE